MGIIPPPLSSNFVRYMNRMVRIDEARREAVSAGNDKLAAFWDRAAEIATIRFYGA